MGCFRCGAAAPTHANFCRRCDERPRAWNVGLPGWPTREVAEGQATPFARRLALAFGGAEFHHHGNFRGSGFPELFEELENRFGPFADTRVARRPDGSLDLAIDSTDGLLQIMSALETIAREGDEQEAFVARTMGNALLMPLGLPFDPTGAEDTIPVEDRNVPLPLWRVPTATQVAQRLYELRLAAPISFSFSDEPEVRRVLGRLDGVAGVRVESAVPTDFDRAVAQSFGAATEALEFFQSPLEPTIVVWVADATAVRDVLEALVSFAFRPSNAPLADVAMNLAESILEEIGFSWE